MSEIDYQALREAAEQAIHYDWGYDADIFHEQVTPSVVLALLDENERMCRNLIARNGEIEGLRRRAAELEKIATDHALKFRKAQDALKYALLMLKDARKE
ncbi:ead/Ea22-like family protein [Escherichia coli]|nr:ead/Ea22-like family protein [Escherichia coli]EKI3095218.1 ead/Ea22-like family protein [Escherichia coli]HAM4850807.1 ead/Ea22-like family protein [Escherichia coli]